jgi:DNA-binding MarR family transcriptional regulator
MFLKKMLEYISDKGYVKVDEISQQFGVPKSFVEHAFQELLRKEYIRVLHSEDEKITCASCPLKNVCYIGKSKGIKYYVLTEKGKELLSRENKLIVGASE